MTLSPRSSASSGLVRLVVFGSVGPPIGCLVFILTSAVSAAGGHLGWLEYIAAAIVGFFGLPTAYAFGLGPALVTGWTDYHLDDRHRLLRWSASSLVGAASSTLVGLLFGWNPEEGALAGVAAAGAVAGLVCSVLTHRLRQGRRSEDPSR